MGNELVYNRDAGLGRVDRILLKGARARKSAHELSAMTNGVVSPIEADARVEEILNSRDRWTDAQMRLLLVDDLMELKDELQRRVLDLGSQKDVPGLIRLFQLIDKTLSDNKLDYSKAMREIDAARAQLWLQAISLNLEKAFLELEKRYPNIAKAELLDIYHETMPETVLQIESLVPKDA